MNTFVKVTLIAAAVLAVLGILILALTFFLGGNSAGTESFELMDANYDVAEDFSVVNVKCIQSKIILCESEDGACHVECKETESMAHSVDVTGNTLNIVQKDSRPWFRKLWFFADLDTSVTIKLPKKIYDELKVENTSGAITAEGGMSFLNAALSNTSGRIDFSVQAAENLSIAVVSGGIDVKNINAHSVAIASTSGKIALSDMQIKGALNVAETSGKTELSKVSCDSLKIKTVSGKVELSDTTAQTSMRIEDVSGRVELDGCDSKDIYVETVSGAVKATLLTGKIFTTHTTSGRVNVPESTDGFGRCEIKTISGGIDVDIGE